MSSLSDRLELKGAPIALVLVPQSCASILANLILLN